MGGPVKLTPGIVALTAAIGAASCLLLPASSAMALGDGAAPPAWAYPVNPPNLPPAHFDQGPLHLPHSSRSFLAPQLTDRFNVPDWYPADHPSMPEVVSRGRAPDVAACGYCHLPDGAGRPENASLAGLPAAYIVQQLADMRDGTRRTAVPERAPPQMMFALSHAMTDAEIRAAAAYFSALPPHNRTRVIEAAFAPHSHVAGWFLAADRDAPREPIGQRIIEVPESLEQFEQRDERVRIFAYVPPGSITAGGELVRTGGANRTLACAGCHGADLRGVGNIPAIAGRSPSYIVRQLFDIQSGVRAGAATAPMNDVVRHLQLPDMIAIASYLATRH
jgi:cytochrome c553